MVHGPKGYDMDLGNPWARQQFALTFETLSSSKMLAKNGYLKCHNGYNGYKKLQKATISYNKLQKTKLS